MPRNESVDSLLREAVAITDPASIGAIGPLPGEVLAGRFLIERWIGNGGMGAIHRALDLQTHEPTAIKVLAFGGRGDAQRFAREAAVLAELSHPAIVRYLAHGHASGAQFLAMEWLEGEDLECRLARAPLSVPESLAVLRRACEALAYSHARGIVHRDLKPSNLFLVERDPARTKLLDFGIARQAAGSRTLTQSRAVIGTVGYMSPEQAFASHRVDARSDLFALGCVMFECLTGSAAFSGPNAVAVLAKLLHEDPPPISELCTGLPPGLAAIVSRLLAKDPEQRPKDAAALLCELDALGDVTQPAAASPSARGVTTAEQKLVSVILAAPARTNAGALRELRKLGAEPAELRDGGLLVVLGDSQVATDQASHAARCALALRRFHPDRCIALATGSAETLGRVPVGVAIDRAAELLALSAAAVPAIFIHELTAGLLEPSFEVHRDAGHLTLVAERLNREATRRLLGRPTPFVGRDTELGLLELTLRECVSDRVARAVLVIGPPGQGKSRLRHEFVKRVRDTAEVKILTARAEQVGAGTAFALAAQLVRDAAGSGEAAQLRAYLEELCPHAAARLADFLGELIGSPALEPGPELLLAREDKRSMAAWLRRSFDEWLGAELVAQPLLIVLEDLHWADLPSVTYLGESLGASSARPLMLLALARPEVHDAFPHLWGNAEKLELALNRLTQRAAEKLVREVLGADVTPQAVARIVERAAGNAFYLEELIRHFAEAGDARLPETVLALVHSRLERLDAEPRRFARAASIFGQAFWLNGVAQLLRSDATPHDVEACVRALLSAEVISLAPAERFAGEREYCFRHAFLREGAYAMLTAADKSTGHRLAGHWLEEIGESNALTLAEHFELGGDSPSAVRWLLRATDMSLDAGSAEAVMALAERAIQHGVSEPARGVLGRLRGMALMQRGDLVGAVAVGREALALLPAGSQDWLRCAANLYSAAAFLGDQRVAGEMLVAIASLPPEPSLTYGWTIGTTCPGLIAVGELDLADELLDRVETAQARALLEQQSHPELRQLADAGLSADLGAARAYALLMRGELGRAYRRLQQATDSANAVLSEAARASCQLLLVATHAELGRADLAEAQTRELIAQCEPAGLEFIAGRSTAFLAAAKLNAGCAAEAIGMLAPLLERADGQLAGSAHARLAHALLATGALDDARTEAQRALARAPHFPAVQVAAFAALALLELHAGTPEAALAHCTQGLAHAARGAWPRDVTILRLAHAQALHASGRNDEAQAAIRAARARLQQIASGLEDAQLARVFLSGLDANVRTLQLADAWLAGGAE